MLQQIGTDIVPLGCGQLPVAAVLQSVVGHPMPQAAEGLHVGVHLLGGEQLVREVIDDMVGNGRHIRQTANGRDGLQGLLDGHPVIRHGAKEGSGNRGGAVIAIQDVHAGAVGDTGRGGIGGMLTVGGRIDQGALAAHTAAHDHPRGGFVQAVLLPQSIHHGVHHTDSPPIHPAPGAGEQVGQQDAMGGQKLSQGALVVPHIHTTAQAGAAPQAGELQHEGYGGDRQQVGVGIAVGGEGFGVDETAVGGGVIGQHGTLLWNGIGDALFH